MARLVGKVVLAVSSVPSGLKATVPRGDLAVGSARHVAGGNGADFGVPLVGGRALQEVDLEGVRAALGVIKW